MAFLVPCQACGQEISDEAKLCPTCGHPQQQQQLISEGDGVFVFLFACFSAFAGPAALLYFFAKGSYWQNFWVFNLTYLLPAAIVWVGMFQLKRVFESSLKVRIKILLAAAIVLVGWFLLMVCLEIQMFIKTAAFVY